MTSRAGCAAEPPATGAVAVQAAVLTAPQRLALRTIELRPPGDGEVRLRVRSCGVCASNLELWRRGPRSTPTPAGAMGHEIAATVEAVGGGVTGLRAGDLVCVEPNLAVACGECRPCRSGGALRCSNPATIPSWGFAEMMVVRAAGALRVPAGIGTGRASLAEPLACAVHALRRSQLSGGDDRLSRPARVAVVGAGALGLLTAFVAARSGAGPIGVVARHAHQASLAGSLAGAIPLSAQELGEFAADLVVIAAGGADRLLALAVDAIVPDGEIIVLGRLADPQPFNLRRAAFREARIVFAISYGGRDGALDFDRAIALLADAPDLDALITHRRPLHAIEEAYALAADRAAGAIRVVIEPDGSSSAR